MKKERRPPKTWRRNMLFATALLAVLDGTILSATPSLTRVLIAAVVTLAVGGFIVGVWISNTKMEKAAAADPTKRPPSGGKPAAGGRPGK